jgi:hypothetical protein
VEEGVPVTPSVTGFKSDLRADGSVGGGGGTPLSSFDMMGWVGVCRL